MHPILNIAGQAALAAGHEIIRGLNRQQGLQVSKKGRNDFVSDIDRKAEQVIIETIRKAYPQHAILAEESGRQGDDDEHLWIVDPLDGTTNFLHGFPVFAVSIAFHVRGRPECGLIYDPLRQELFQASRGNGATVDGHRIRVSNLPTLENSLIGTGFPFRDEKPFLNEYLDCFRAVIENAAGVRRAGAATLDLAYVAAGRLDGFWESGLSPWDMAAGAIIIREAGGYVTDFAGTDDYLDRGHIIAGNPKLYQALMKLLHPLLPKELL